MIAALSLLGSVLGSSSTSAASATSPVALQSSISALTSDPHADFGQVLGQMSSDAIGNLKTAEATSIAGMQGKASVQQVVEAVTSAQQSLQMATAVRDKVVSAYQEISKMTI